VFSLLFAVLWSLLRPGLLLWVSFSRFCGSGEQFGASLGPDLDTSTKKFKKSQNFDHFLTKYWLQRGAFLHPWRPRGRLGAPLGGQGVLKWSPRGSKLHFRDILKTVLLLRVYHVFRALGSPGELKMSPRGPRGANFWLTGATLGDFSAFYVRLFVKLVLG